MTIPIYIGIAATLFIIGMIFVLKGIPNEEATAVPISNPKEIQKLKQAFTPPENDEAKVSQTSESTEMGRREENRILEENHQLRKEITEEKGRCEQLEQRMEALQREYERMKGQNEDIITKLKEEYRRSMSEKESLPSGEGLAELKAKTELLEKQYEKSQAQQEEMKTMVEQLKTEKDILAAQIELKEQQAAKQITAQTAAASKAEFEAMSNKLIEAIAAIETLKRENNDLQQANSELQDQFAKTEELNAQLMKREKMMQYELTKNRAQALGLEKICADFRTQIEMMAGSTSNT